MESFDEIWARTKGKTRDKKTEDEKQEDLKKLNEPEQPARNYPVSSSTRSFDSIWHETGEKGSDPYVDAVYIDLFRQDANRYLSSMQSDYESMNKDNASSIYQTRKQTADDLRKRSTAVRQYLKKNKDSLDPNAYQDFTSFLEEFDKVSSQSIYEFYKGSEYLKLPSLDRMNTEQLRIAQGTADGNEIAYTDENGRNYTWNTMHHYAAQKEDVEAKKAEYQKNDDWYEKSKNTFPFENGVLTSDYGIMVELSQNIYPEKWEYAEIDGIDRRDWDNWRAKRKYIEDKYNVDLTSDPYDADNILSNLISQLWNNGEADTKRFDYLNEMTYSEQAVLNYIFNTQGRAAAMDWYEQYEDIYQDRYNRWVRYGADVLGKEMPAFGSAVSLATQMAAPVEYALDLIDYSQGGERPYNTLANITSGVRSSVAENHIDWEVGGYQVGDMLYNTGMSALDSVIASKVMGAGGGALLGMSAAAQATNDAYDRGLDDAHAISTGLSAGVAELIFESISIGKMKSMKEVASPRGKEIIKNLVKTMTVNASEEALTEVANIASDFVINGWLSDEDFSEYATSVRMYQASGYTPEEAKSKARTDLGVRVAEAAASGGLMGLGFGTFGQAGAIGKSFKNFRADTRTARGLSASDTGMQKLKDLAMEVATEQSGRYSKRMNTKIGKVDSNPSVRNIRSLYRSVSDAYATQIKSDVIKSLKRKGFSNRDATALGTALTAEATGGIIGAEESGILRKYQSDSRLIETRRNLLENAKSSVGQRMGNLSGLRKDATRNLAMGQQIGLLDGEGYDQEYDSNEYDQEVDFNDSHFQAFEHEFKRNAVREALEEQRASGRISEEVYNDYVTMWETANARQDASLYDEIAWGLEVETPTTKKIYEMYLEQKQNSDNSMNGAGTEVTSDQAANVADNDTMDAKETSATEVSHEAHTDGQTIRKSTGETVAIQGISSVRDGKMTFRTEDGAEVDAEDVSFGSREEALVYEAVAQLEGIIDAEAASGLAKHLLKLGEPMSDTFVRGIVQAYQYGYSGYGREAARGENTLSAQLTERQRNVAYGRGQKYRQAKTAADQTKADKGYKKTAKRSKSPDGKHYDNVQFEGKVKKWGEKQRADVEFLNFVARDIAGGVTVHVFESFKGGDGKRYYYDSNGKRQRAPNGKYIRANGDIYLDLNAGDSGEGLALNTFAHELYHHIEKWSPAKARQLAEFLVKEQGLDSVGAMVDAQIEKAEATGHGVQYFMKQGMSRTAAENTVKARAFSDFVADSLETVFTKGDALGTLQRLKKSDQGLFDKIKAFVDKWVSKLKKYYRGDHIISIEGQVTAQLETFEQIQELFMEALVDAGENFRNADTVAAEKSTADSGEVYSIRNDIVDVNGVEYESVVELDYGMFKKIIRKGSVFIDFVRNTLSRQKITVYKADGNSEVIEFAKVNDRAQKNGTDHPKRVLGKLERANGSTKKLVIANAKETAEISTFQKHKMDNSHQWLDANGWDERKSFVMTRDQIIYPVILHVAKAKDGRNILYDVSVMTSEGVDVDKDATSRRAKTQAGQAVKSTTPSDGVNITRSAPSVNDQFSDRNVTPTSNRSLLANALETAVQNDAERQKLQNYREKINQIEKDEQKLSDLKKQLYEMAFAKGPRDAEYREKRSDLKEVADSIERRLNRTEKELLELEATKPLKDLLKREKDAVKRRMEKKHRQVLRTRKEEAAKEQAALKAEYSAQREKAVAKARETAEKRDARAKLQKLVLDTVKWISYPAKTDVRCPDILKKPYEAFLQGIDLSSKRFASGGEDTQNDLRLMNAMDSLATALDKIMTAQDPSTDPNKVDSTVLDAGYLDLPTNFVQKLRDMTEKIKDMMVEGEYVVNTMTADEVKKLSQTIRTLNHAIRTMSELNANLRFANVEALGLDTMEFLDALGEIEKTGGMKDFAQWDNALPYYAFKRFGKGGESVFEGLMDAQDKLAFLARDIFNFQRMTWTEKEAKAWSEDTHTISLPNGTKLTLTTADAMSIYCLSRREQGLQHLLGGGVRVMGIQKGSKKAKDSRSLLTIQDVDAIISSLTDRQTQVADDIQGFMSTVCSEWGNEISMKRFLTREFNEKFYFPIESNDENLTVRDPAAQQSDLFRLLNISATKPLTQGANNEVIIRNIFDVFTGHASDMARLNAYGMALLDYMKWLNYRKKVTGGEGQINVRGVRKSMEKAYGKAANSYVLNLIKDVNGRPSDSSLPGFYTRLVRNTKTAMVGNSLRVATLQITSYPRAALVLSPKSLALGLTKLPNIKRAKKYCGIALWKSFGFYDTNISRSIEDQMKGVKNFKQKLIELSLKGAEIGDAMTWGALWNACEYEVASLKHYKVGSDEFYEAVGKKLREVVYRTQVVDSTLTRSEMMRSKNAKAQELSAFMSESTLSANILMDAGFEFNMEKRRTGSAKAAWKKTGKYVSRAVAVYSIGQLAAALMEGLWDAWRDDEDEEFSEKFLRAFKKNLILDLLPFNKLPILSDIAEAAMSLMGIGYFSSDSLSSTAIAQAVSAAKAWAEFFNGESSITAYNAIYKTTRAVSSFFGFSISGVMREGVALWNNTAGAYDATLKVLTYERSNTEMGNLLLDAIIEGNDRRADSLRSELGSEEACLRSIRAAIKERFKAGEIDRETAIEYLVAHGGVNEDKAFWYAEEWEYEAETNDDYGKYNEFYDAVKTGKNLKSVIKKYTDNGVREETLASQITNHFKPIYIEMSTSEKAGLKGYLLNAYELCGVDRKKASDKLASWQYESDHHKIKDVATHFKYTNCPDGVPANAYVAVVQYKAKAKSQEDMANYINSLSLTKSQKDALWCLWWSEETLKQTPWRK